MRVRLLLIALLNFWLDGSLQSQNTLAMPAVQNFDKRLYQAGVQNWDIQQDAKGNIYVANNEGLLVYDGSRWQLFPLSNKTIVRSVCIDPKGRVFVGGQDEIGYFEANEQGRLVYHSLTSLIPAPFASMGDVWDIVCKGNSVFFRSFNAILNYQDPVIVGYRPKSEWQYLGMAGSQLIAQDSRSGLMVYQNNGWYPIEFKQSLPPDALVTALMPFGPQTYLLTTLKHGLFKWSNQSISPWATDALSNWQESRIYHATTLSNQRFALASSLQGLFVIDRNGTIIQHLAKAQGLQNNNILHVFADRQENLWVGLDNGIDCIAFNSAIRQINPRLEDGAGYAALQFNKELFVGTSNGLYQVNLESGTGLDFARGEFKPVAGMNGQIWSLNAVNNQVLIGHHEGASALMGAQVQSLSRETGHWAFLPQTETFPTERIIAGNYKGLSIFQYQQNKFLPLGLLPNFNESSRFIALDADQQIWVSHPYHGTFRIRQRPDGSTETLLFSQKEGLPSALNNYVFKIRQEILAATDKGVFRYNRQTQRFALAADYQQWLGGQSVRYLREDLKGNVWFVHEKQVGVLDFSTPDPKKIDLPELTRKILSGFEMIYPFDEQHVIIGAEKGFFLVNLEQYKKASKPLRVQIRGVHLVDKQDSLVYGGFQRDSSQSIALEQSVAPHWKSIRFEYAAAVYPADQALEYSYRLNGFDNQWSAWSSRTDKEYTNLPRGNYRFEVRARKSVGSESAPVSFAFEVLPPWHQSNGAIAAYVLIGLLGSWLLYRRQQKKFKRQQRRYELEQQRLRYIYDLERAKAESELVALRNEKLEAEIQYKNAEMAASALHLVQKGELMSTMKEELSRLMKVIDQPKAIAEIKNIVKRLSDDENFEQEWEQFSKYFDKVHSDFVTELKHKHPSLTPSESKLCIYLRMNMSTKEIAQLLNISVRGVEISRYRLRKKLQLPTERNLFDYLIEIKQD